MPGLLALVEHPQQVLPATSTRDVQVEVVLLLEVERQVRRLEERQAGPVVHLVEGVQGVGGPAALGLRDLEGVDQRQAKEALVNSRVSSESRQR